MLIECSLAGRNEVAEEQRGRETEDVKSKDGGGFLV
jgi:hypothetical protein